MTIGPDFVPRLATKARLKHDRHEDKWMILWPERGLALNASAAAIAQRIDGVRTIASIAESLASEHGADRAVVERDVIAFVSSLAEKGLLDGLG
ncbi:MAG TPA: pyrroloquinoline quinone biosynthesis peptide chaperone PqqD [Labilithrix sp.]|jgi:coenzyme PQQ biosynthesis protein PqqD